MGRTLVLIEMLAYPFAQLAIEHFKSDKHMDREAAWATLQNNSRLSKCLASRMQYAIPF